MWMEVAFGFLLPFLGTTLGAAGVFGMRKRAGTGIADILSAFAAGVMCAASVWSLLLPAIEQSATWGRLGFLPAIIGFWIGMMGLVGLDRLFLLQKTEEQRSLLLLSVTLHNIPEGMAVGVIYAGLLLGKPGITSAAALTLSLGIALQNIPEGAILSLPMYAEGRGRGRSFLWGMLSGAVEPLAAVLTLLVMETIVVALPYLLGFAAGAMFYVVVVELIPKCSRHRLTPMAFSVGFTLMLALDVALG